MSSWLKRTHRFENSLNKICIRLVRVHHTGTHTQEGLREKARETEGRMKAGWRAEESDLGIISRSAFKGRAIERQKKEGLILLTKQHFYYFLASVGLSQRARGVSE